MINFAHESHKLIRSSDFDIALSLYYDPLKSVWLVMVKEIRNFYVRIEDCKLRNHGLFNFIQHPKITYFIGILPECVPTWVTKCTDFAHFPIVIFIFLFVIT